MYTALSYIIRSEWYPLYTALSSGASHEAFSNQPHIAVASGSVRLDFGTALKMAEICRGVHRNRALSN